MVQKRNLVNVKSVGYLEREPGANKLQTLEAGIGMAMISERTISWFLNNLQARKKAGLLSRQDFQKRVAFARRMQAGCIWKVCWSDKQHSTCMGLSRTKQIPWNRHLHPKEEFGGMLVLRNTWRTASPKAYDKLRSYNSRIHVKDGKPS